LTRFRSDPEISSEDLDEMSDSDIIIMILWFCEKAKQPAQIMNYCHMNGIQFNRLIGHCIRRGLLRAVTPEQGLLAMETTDRGREVLEAADKIISSLGLEPDEPLK
jgi:predicted transcriptional regulator